VKGRGSSIFVFFGLVDILDWKSSGIRKTVVSVPRLLLQDNGKSNDAVGIRGERGMTREISVSC